MKKRLDILVSEKLETTRSKAQGYIMAGRVLVDGKSGAKAGQEFNIDTNIKITEISPYVSRGALKLEGATKKFDIDFKNKIVCDIGASTGGFTDFALQSGAKKVYAIDVGYGQLDQKLRNDKRVINMERTNIRNVKSLPEDINIFVIDVSFISLKKVLPQVILINNGYHSRRSTLRSEPYCSDLKSESSLPTDKTGNLDPRVKPEDDKGYRVVALIKPQFEVGKKIADKFKGVIKNEKIQKEVVAGIESFAKKLGYIIEGITESPIKGAKGNIEFLIYLSSCLPKPVMSVRVEPLQTLDAL